MMTYSPPKDKFSTIELWRRKKCFSYRPPIKDLSIASWGAQIWDPSIIMHGKNLSLCQYILVLKDYSIFFPTLTSNFFGKGLESNWKN